MVPETDVGRFAAAHCQGAFVIDVREPIEYIDGHVPGARLVPMAQLPARVSEFPRGQRVYVICASGNRSYTAAALLRQAGVDAVSVAGGTAHWLRQGRPVARGPYVDAPAAVDRAGGL